MARPAGAGGERCLTLAEDDHQQPEEIPDSRPAGLDPPGSWTARDIERWVVIPMRMLREGDMMVLPGNRHVLMAPNAPPSNADILAFAREVLVGRPLELQALVTWARIKAKLGDPNASIESWCEGMGWKERTFYRRKDRAVALVAVAKNKADRDVRTRGRNGP